MASLLSRPVIVALKANHTEVQVAHFLEDRDSTIVAKRKMPAKAPDTIKTHKLVRRRQKLISKRELHNVN